MASRVQKLAFLFVSLALPLNATAAIELLNHVTADVASSYNWGNYATGGQTDSTHSGVGLQLLLGFRHVSRFEFGLTAAFAFPQITVADSTNDAAFSYRSLGLQAGYLWRDKIEPFIHYSPFAQLTQSTKSRVGVNTVSTDLGYTGQAFGAGMKIYLSPRNEPVAQLGLRFMYSRESYGTLKVDSTAESNSERASPGAASGTTGQHQDQSVSGNTYSAGFFVGI